MRIVRAGPQAFEDSHAVIDDYELKFTISSPERGDAGDGRTGMLMDIADHFTECSDKLRGNGTMETECYRCPLRGEPDIPPTMSPPASIHSLPPRRSNEQSKFPIGSRDCFVVCGTRNDTYPLGLQTRS
jgi:hypothetical protein